MGVVMQRLKGRTCLKSDAESHITVVGPYRHCLTVPLLCHLLMLSYRSSVTLIPAAAYGTDCNYAHGFASTEGCIGLITY